ncbi:bile acid:sodium symporter [Sphingomonas naphthae]|uniref:Bile acid:sodium symporter n=1 Tax=Sphingomonas naphthae TaxID=1813468 RepID=A0ABY7TRL7_9SPHN|nr:bile acid:sodium symporter family protein [Sphingomonas naphthae]WCT74484.1 bile acid:sodium symporter [Sphingomonas naphthae]
MKIDGFLIAMASAIVLALLFPWVGMDDGPVHLGILTTIGIAGVFFLHGANLAPKALRDGALHWRLHLLVQGTTFLFFPLIGAALYFASEGWLPDGLRLGFFYLGALSSTISSSVAMTAMARGNVAVAVFNATLSGLIGMVATPLLVRLVSTVGAGGPAVGEAILDILKTLLLPFALGQACRPLIGAFLHRHKKVVSTLDRGVIVLIVFGSFAESTASGLWRQFSPQSFLIVTGLAAGMLALALFFTISISRLLKLDTADEAAAVFCGSKKSLANGAPIAKILFAGNPAIGMIVLPVLLYHQIQLIVCASLARRYALHIQRLAPLSEPSESAFQS